MVSRYTHQVLDFFNNHEDKKRAEIWTKDKFNNKRHKPLSKQMERKLSEFSRPQQPTYQIQNPPDTEERRTIPIIPNKEALVKDNKLVTKEGIKTDDILLTKPGPEKNNQREPRCSR